MGVAAAGLTAAWAASGRHLRAGFNSVSHLQKWTLWLLKAQIQTSKNKLDDMAKKQTRQCENQAKRKEAREYLRDKKGPSKFCGNMHSSQAPKELVQGMPVGILRINQGSTETTNELVKRIQGEVPSAEVQRAERQ